MTCDSQLETTLLRSHLTLPKFFCILRTCPPSHTHNTALDFDAALHDTLTTILGSPLSEWSWLKASLPSTRSGVNLRSATLHLPAAFVASGSCHSQLITDMFSTLTQVSAAASCPNWQQLDDINMPLQQ